MLACADVARDADDAGHAAARVAKGPERGQKGLRPPRAPEALLERARLAGRDHGPIGGAGRRPRRRSEQVQVGVPDDLPRRRAERPGRHGVDHQVAACKVLDEDPRRHSGKQRLEQVERSLLLAARRLALDDGRREHERRGAGERVEGEQVIDAASRGPRQRAALEVNTLAAEITRLADAARRVPPRRPAHTRTGKTG